MKWLNDYFPDSEQWNSFRGVLLEMKDKVKENIELGTVSVHYFVYACVFGSDSGEYIFCMMYDCNHHINITDKINFVVDDM
jgi:hypothetical protein